MTDFSRRLAVVIGINQYENGIPTLRNAVNDAQKIDSILKEQHDYKTWLLLDENATKGKLEELLTETLPNEVKKDPNCPVLFYFAGHGIALPGDDGPQGYLIPQDANPTPGDSSSYLSMSDVHKWLTDLGCHHFLGILDCCFAGAFRWSSTRDFAPVPEEIYQEHYDRFIEYPAWQVITSASYDETALDILSLSDRRGEKDNHSPFAAALIDALNGEADTSPPAKDGKPAGDGVITATELYSYLRDRIEPATIKIKKRQTPGLLDLKKHDRGQYIFLNPKHDELNLRNAPSLDESTNPYQGLKSFEEDHKDLFFGRTKLVEKLYDFVNDQPLTVVLGTSGAGKSSLVKAGLIPKLKKNQPNWTILDPIRPGESPFWELNNALKKASLPEVEIPDAAEKPKNLNESIKVWKSKKPNSKLVLFIDQSEELITLCKNQEERDKFLKQLADGLTKYPELRVVINVRSDFEPQLRHLFLDSLSSTTNLPKNASDNPWQKGRFIVPAMTRDKLQEVIEKPAEKNVMYFKPHNLVETLINEVAGMPGALPLLSFALSELYLNYLRRQEKAKARGEIIDRAITQEDYEQIGGVTQSLTKRADEEYQKLVNTDPDYEQIVRNVMLRMVTLDGGEVSRRRVAKSELEYSEKAQKKVDEVIKRFSDARLLIAGPDAENNPSVEPAHDALVKGWDKLRLWMNQEQETLFLQERLTPAANDWKKKQGTLWTEEDGRLLRLRQVINSDQNWLNKVETDFVSKSIEGKQKRLEEEEKQRDEALQGQVTALAALSEARFQDDQLGALIHILKAGRILQQLIRSNSKWVTQNICISTEVVLRQILSKVKEFNRLEDKDISLAELSFTSNKSSRLINSQGRVVPLNSIYAQEMILMQDSQGIFKCWQLDGTFIGRIPPDLFLVKSSLDGQMFAHFIYRSSQIQEKQKRNAILLSLKGKEVILQEDERDTLMTFDLSPNGQLIAFGGYYGALYIGTTDGKKVEKKQQFGSVNSINFSPNSEMLATGGKDKKIRLWNQNGELVRTIEAHKDAIWGVSFSPDGETLASVSTDTTVKIWKTDGTLLITLNGHKNVVRAVCFNSDGQILASASDDGSVRLWKPNGTKLKSLNDHHTSLVYAVRFNPKQPMIATTSGQGQLILWSQDGRLLRNWENAHFGTITALDFSPNGRMFVTAAGDREVKLWKLDDDKDKQDFRPYNLGNHTGDIHLPTVFGVSFSSDNQTILLGIGSQDGKGSLELCDSESKECRIIAQYDCPVIAVCFSPDGQMFALGKRDGSVELWRKEEDEFRFLINLNQHSKVVFAVCFSPDGKFLATGSADKTVNLWQIDKILNNAPTHILEHTDVVTAVRFSPNGEFIATASYDKTVKIWNIDGSLKKTLHGHNDRVNALDFSPDGKTLASASNDKTAILWNLEQELGLDQLIDYGCEWISDYLTNNPNVSESDRKLLKIEEFPTLQYQSKEWMQ